MTQKLDKIIIVDIEATCWQGANPPGMENDIIEIGICLLDLKTYEITENKGIMVIPERSTISSFCTELTTITADMIEKEGIGFKEACEILKNEYNSQNRPWASFGMYDINQFQKQCAATGVPYPFGPSHTNVKTLFASKNKLPHKKSMAGALDILGIKLEGTPHRGVDDAYNIAKILKWILKSN
jgi:inhibitor of KinA sporulation pathway (predicted exonuclease)